MLNIVSAEETNVEDEICKRSDSSPEPSEAVDENKNLESNLEELEDKKTIDGIDEEIDPTDDKKTDCADDKSVNGVLVSKDTVNDQQTVEIKDQLVLIENNKSESDSAILPLLRSWLNEGSESSRYIQLLQRNLVIFNFNFNFRYLHSVILANNTMSSGVLKKAHCVIGWYILLSTLTSFLFQ